MNAKSKVAVVGAGFIADYHLQVLKGLPGVEVIALVDVDRARAEALARKHGVVRVHASIAEMVAAGKPDVAHALVPPQRHVDVATELLEAGVGVFLEKPLATNRGDAQRLLLLAAARGLPLAVNHNATFHPSFRAAKATLARGELGELDHVFACLSVPLRQLNTRDFAHFMFRTPRNIIFEQATHPFSQLVDLLGPVRSVTSVPGGRRELAPGVVFYDTWQLALTHERGTASLHLSFGRDFAESFVRLLGQDGSLHVDLLRGHVTQTRKTPWPDFWDQWKNAQSNALALLRAGGRGALDYMGSTLKLRGRSDLFFVGMRDSLAAFHASLRGGLAYPCDAQQGLQVVECCDLAAAAVPDAEASVATSAAPAAVAATPAARLDAAASSGDVAVAVTGANGFLGTHLVERLLRAGQRVHALVRKPAFVPDALRRDGVTLFSGELSDPAALERAFSGCAAVVHLATGGGDTWADFERTMLGGARTVANACAASGAKRLVYTSSIAVYDLGDASAAPVTEDAPLDPDPARRSLYARGKIATEALLRALAVEQKLEPKLELVLARPGLVVGSRGAPQHSGVGFWAKDSQVFGWGGGNKALPFVTVEDVADGLARMALLPAAANRSYNLVGDVRLTAREWVELLRNRLHRDFQFHPESITRWYLEELFKYAVKLAIRKPGAEAPSFRDLATRSAARPFDNTAPKRELGWQPIADRAAFLAATLPPPRATAVRATARH